MAGVIGKFIKRCLFPIDPPALQVKPIARMPSKKNHSAITCTPLLEIYGSLFCVDNYHIVFKDGSATPKVLSPIKVLPRSKGDDFEAYSLDDGFAIRYQDHDYFFMAKFEIVEVYGMRIFDIKQPIIYTEIIDNEMVPIDSSKEGAQ